MRNQEKARKQAAAWDGIDSLGAGSGKIQPSVSVSTASQDDDDWGFGMTAPISNGSSSRGKAEAPKPHDDDWGLGDFVSAPTITKTTAPPQAQSQTQSQSLWDLDEFTSPHPPPTAPTIRQPTAPTPRSNTPADDFDFGDREDRLLDNDSHDEGDDDDILGALSKPVDAIPKRSSPVSHICKHFHFHSIWYRLLIAHIVSMTQTISNRSNGTPSPQPNTQPRNGIASRNKASNPTSRPVSPPPHILGQIVEMGFSPQQARVALAATDTGLDVQAALDMLLSADNADASGSRDALGGWGAGLESRESEWGRDRPRDRNWEDEEEDESTRRRPPQRPRPRPSPAHTTPTNTRDIPSASGSAPQQERNVQQIQEQADKLIAQASEIGISVFNRANAFWKEGKERAQRLYEERAAVAAAAASSRDSRGGDGRPKWMQDRDVRDDEEGMGDGGWKTGGKSGNGGEGAFADDDDDGDEVPPPMPKRPTKAGSSRQKVAEPQPRPPAQQNTRDLFSDAPAAAYVSPFRRGRSKADTTPKSTPPRAPSPIQLTQRNAVPATPSALATSAKHKTSGTEKYKLGQFGDAESAYSSAIASLPSSHLLLVPLLNNRALTRLKTGNASGAVEDCTTVVELVGVTYHPAREAKVTRDDCGAGVDLGEGLVKALKRRAEAWEGREKWEEAGKDWEVLGGIGWAATNVRSEAVRGAGRCRRMASAGSAVDESQPKPKPKPAAPKKPSSRHVPIPPSQALNNLHDARNAQEAEDQQRLELKDIVDARLLAWKGGKETNIRALIASLETVLWPELGWQKVGMAEVVTPSQVKIRYMKAIAKLHPDKVCLCSCRVLAFGLLVIVISNCPIPPGSQFSLMPIILRSSSG